MERIKTIKECIDQFLEKGPLGDKIKKSAIKEAWGEVTGDSVRKRTQDLWLHNEKLMVRIGSGPVKHFLLTNRVKLKEKIEERVPGLRIREIVIL